MHIRYRNPDDQRVFARLVNKGLTEQAAIDQMALMGIEASKAIPIHHYSGFDDLYNYSFPSEHKKAELPYYHGKRRF